VLKGGILAIAKTRGGVVAIPSNKLARWKLNTLIASDA